MRRPVKPKQVHVPEPPFTVRIAERRCFEGVTFLSALMPTTRRYVQLSINDQNHRFSELSVVEANDLLTVLKTMPDPEDKLGTTLRVLDFRKVVKKDLWVPAAKFGRVRMYPCNEYNVGDVVRIVRKTEVKKAIVDSVTVMPPDHLHHGRIRLKLLDEDEVVHYHEKPKRIFPIFGQSTTSSKEAFHPEIVVCSDTPRFRSLSRVVPESYEHVLEVGCSTGEATKILAKHSSRVSALDVGAEMVEMTRAQFSEEELEQVSVEVVDVRKEVWFLMYCEETLIKYGDVDVAFIDVGGQSPIDQVAAALQAVLRYAKVRRVIVVKSMGLWKYLEGVAEDELGDRLRSALNYSKPRRRQLTRFEKTLKEEKT